MSKTIAPGLRIGWIIAAPEMIDALTLAKQGSDLCTGGVQQAIALEALEQRLVERQAPMITALYRERRDALCAAIETHLSPWFTWEKPTGGMFVWLTAKNDIDTDRLLAAALDGGVAFTPSSVFDPAGTNRESIRMNFTLNPPEILREGVARLGRVVEAFVASKG
jgi:2-aminoadipate transaminase